MKLLFKKIIIILLGIVTGFLATEVIYRTKLQIENQIQDLKSIKVDDVGYVTEQFLQALNTFKPSSKKLILLSGSSIAHQLATSMNTQIDTATFEIFNAGIHGYDLEKNLKLLQKYSPQLHPQILIQEIHNIPKLDSIQAEEDHFNLVKSYIERLANDSHFYESTLFKNSRLLQHLFLNFSITTSKAQVTTTAQIEKTIKEIRDFAIDKKMRIIFVVFPLFQKRDEASIYFLKKVKSVLKNLELTSATLDLSEIYSENQLLEFQSSPEDTYHMNARANLEISKLVYNLIKTENK